MIHDVDTLLERLVRRDALNGSSVELVFDAPTKDWVARRNAPTVDLYLYDIREDLQRRFNTWEDGRAEDRTVTARGLPPRRFKLAYLVTAWTQRPEDEHRLLSSLLSCFLRNAVVQSGQLGGSLDETGLPVYIDVGLPAGQDRSLADIWSALGGEMKPALDVVVTAPVIVGRLAPFGPPVLAGPTIGLSSGDGTSETARLGRGESAGPAAADQGDAALVEAVPRGSGEERAPGLNVRVRAVRRRAGP